MRVVVPEYSKLIASDTGEAVLSSPAWYHEHGDDSAVFVDAHRWPPHLVKHHRWRIAAAARYPDGQWVCLVKRDGEWRISWFTDIRATTPARSEPPPVTPAEGEDDEPIVRLHVFAGRLLAIAKDGALWIRDAAGWSAHETLRGGSIAKFRNTVLDGKDVLELDDDLYDAQLSPIDTGDCGDLFAVGSRVLAVADARLVDYAREDPVPVLPEHDVTGIEPGPGHMLVLSFSQVEERGTHYSHGLFDALANTVTMLPEDRLGQFPDIVTYTDAGDFVMFDEDGPEDEEYGLWLYTAAEVAALPHVPIAELAVPPRHRLAPLDALGAASRPIVATLDDAIVIALGSTLRFHTVDRPLVVHEIGLPIVAVASTAVRFGALDTNGVLHVFDRDGAPLGPRPAIAQPRSLATAGDTWIAIGAARIALIPERGRTQTLELAGGLAAAVDPDGDILFACEGRRLAYWTRGELRDLPPPVEQIVALAPLGNRQFACAGEHELYQLDLAHGELVRMNRQAIRPFVATNLADPYKPYVAWVTESGSVEVGGYVTGGTIASLPNSEVRYSGYMQPDDREVVIHGLAFMDDGRLVIALDEGRGNIFDRETGAALKLDPQPGDAPSRWMFFCGGKLLIAE